MHLSKSDSAQSVYHTHAEWEAMLKAVSGPREEVESEDTDEDYRQLPHSPQSRRSRQEGREGITNEDMLKVFDAFLGALKNFQTTAPQVTVNPVIDVKLPAVEKTVVFERDERGRLSASRTTERPLTE